MDAFLAVATYTKEFKRGELLIAAPRGDEQVTAQSLVSASVSTDADYGFESPASAAAQACPTCGDTPSANGTTAPSYVYAIGKSRRAFHARRWRKNLRRQSDGPELQVSQIGRRFKRFSPIGPIAISLVNYVG